MARPAAPALPLVEPIVPVLYPQPFDGPEWLFEPKYDGFRGLLYLSGRACHFRSKRGNVLRRFEQLCYWVREELVEREVILDGEVIALDQEGRQDFRLVMRGGGNLHYVVFDVLWLKGKDLRECPLSRRKRILNRLAKRSSTVLSLVFGVPGRGWDLFRAVERLDLEGIVAKRLADPYTPDTVWRKVRNGAYTQTEGRRDLFHRRDPASRGRSDPRRPRACEGPHRLRPPYRVGCRSP
jgi:bifunctional non-homologous end joining protein LigD